MFFTNLMIFDFSSYNCAFFMCNIFAIGIEATSFVCGHEAAERSGAVRVPTHKDIADSPTRADAEVVA